MLDIEYPPFITHDDNGGLTGIEVDMARDIAHKLGVSLEIAKTDHLDGVVGMVADGRADIGLSNLSITCERAKQVKFTDIYRTLGIVLLLNRLKMASFELTDGVRQLDPLRNITGVIGVIGRSSYEAGALEYFPRAEVKTFDRYREMIRAAERGEILLAVANSETADTFLKESPSLMIRLQPFRLELRDPIAMAVGVESDHLLAWLNAYITVKGMGGR
jgi:ABC-type amino acid transport substrate-binding protein